MWTLSCVGLETLLDEPPDKTDSPSPRNMTKYFLVTIQQTKQNPIEYVQKFIRFKFLGVKY